MFEESRNSVFRKSRDGLEIRNPDGLHITLRGLSASDAEQHAGHLQRLDPEDRRMRFHSALSDAAVADYSSHMDWAHSYVFGVFVDGTLRAMGELIPLDDSQEGELSVSVERDFRKAGLGRILVRALMMAGRRIGLKRIRMVYKRDNDRMRALARSVGAQSEVASDVVEGIVSIQQPN